ncbi:MAG: hypothetical protein K9L68_01600 [Spirochaetales bacterium]|nr:hypothetical protein [Spirochaetales bacterium]MCF7937271.1 hypothetical protein [Spirochaetales bacterium]
MKGVKGVPMPPLVLIACTVVIASAGQLAARGGALLAGQAPLWLVSVLFLGSYLALAGRGVLWLFVLRKMPLSVAYPLYAAVFFLVPAGAAWLYDEAVSLHSAAGWALIGGGVVLTGIRAGKQR